MRSIKMSSKRLRTSNVRFLNSTIAHKFRLAAIKREGLAGITVALALIPESLAFAAIAKVNHRANVAA